MQIATGHRSIGLNFLDDGYAELWVWAPYAAKVSVIMPQKNVLPLQMESKANGYWKLQTDQLKPGDPYGLEIQDADKKEKYTSKPQSIRRADPAALFFKEGIGGFSTAFNPLTFRWTDQDWKGIAQKDYIIYELHVGTFTSNGDLKSIEEKLGYLLELGVTAIEIMPLAQFPGSRNWGYDGVYPFAVHNSYGGPAALQQLVNACHNKGLAVILDVVYNHFGPEGNYFHDFGPYQTSKYHTPWGQAINFDDAMSDPVRHYFIENALMWFRDFHIDALRLDAVHAIRDFGAVHILEEIRAYTNRLSEIQGRNYHLFVELDLNDNRYINPEKRGGYGMGAQWADEFHHALRVAAGQEKSGYYADFNGIEHLAKSYRDAYVYDGQYSPHRKKTFGRRADQNRGDQFIVFSQNHDQTGNRMLGERSSQLVSFEMLKLLAGAVLCSPYLPLLFMGEEYGEESPFLFFISHADKTLVEQVRKGRRAEFAAFHKEGEVPDPQDENTFMASKLQWESLKKDRHQTLFSYYKKLIALRKTHPALSVPDRGNVLSTAYPLQSCLMLMRWQGSQKIMCLMNFSDEEQILAIEDKLEWTNIFDSSSTVWGGTAALPVSVSAAHNVSLKPESISIFINEAI